MPIAFISALWGFALTIVSSLIYRALAALAVGFVTFTGVNVTISFLKDSVLSKLHGLPADTLSLIAYMGVGTAINIYFSALVARMVLNGMSNGALRHFSFQPGGGKNTPFPTLPNS